VIQRLHHAQVTVLGEDEARSFYCDVLGLREVEKPSSLLGRGGFWLQLGECQVHVGTEDGVIREDTKAHLAYQVADIHWKKRLNEEGIPILDSVPIVGFDRFEFRDPFGNRVEMIQPLDL